MSSERDGVQPGPVFALVELDQVGSRLEEDLHGILQDHPSGHVIDLIDHKVFCRGCRVPEVPVHRQPVDADPEAVVTARGGSHPTFDLIHACILNEELIPSDTRIADRRGSPFVGNNDVLPAARQIIFSDRESGQRSRFRFQDRVTTISFPNQLQRQPIEVSSIFPRVKVDRLRSSTQTHLERVMEESLSLVMVDVVLDKSL